MDKIKIFNDSKNHLIKINKIYEQTLKTGKMSKLDFDLLIDHVKDMYESLLQFESDSPASSQVEKIPTHVAQKIHTSPTPEQTIAQEVEIKKEEIFVKKEEEIIEPISSMKEIEESSPFEIKIETPLIEKSISEEPEEIEIKKIEEQPISESVPEKFSSGSSVLKSILSSLDDTSAKETTENLKPSNPNPTKTIHKKDLFNMIGFNEKYIFLSELFAADNSQYLHTIQDLNAMSSFEECLDRIENHWKPLLNWNDNNEGYQYLIKLVELKYI